jgi:hypothetical protein
MFSQAVTPVCEGLLIHRSHSKSARGGDEEAFRVTVVFLLKHTHLVFLVLIFLSNKPFLNVGGFWKWQCFPFSSTNLPFPELRFLVVLVEDGNMLPLASNSVLESVEL